MGLCTSVPKAPSPDIVEEESDSDDEDLFNLRRSASVDNFYRGPLVVMYESLLVNPNWHEYSGSLSVKTHIACEHSDTGKVLGNIAKWPPHEVIPGQYLYVGKSKSLNCCREENIAIACTVTITSEGSRDMPSKTIKLFGGLILDTFPLEFNQPRKIILTDSSKPIQVTEDSVNDSILSGTRWGEVMIKFLPEPPRIKTLYLVRHAESEWNEAQRNRNVLKMMNQVDHPLTVSGANQVRNLGNKIAAWGKCLEQEEILKAKLVQEEEARIESEEVQKIEKAEQAATLAMAAAIESVQMDLTNEKKRQTLFENKLKKKKAKESKSKTKRMLTANEMIRNAEMGDRKVRAEAVMAMYNQAVKMVDKCAEDDLSGRHLLLTLRTMKRKITSDAINDIEVKEALTAHIARLKTLIINRREKEDLEKQKSALQKDDDLSSVDRYILDVVRSSVPSPNFRENAKLNPLVDHLERKFMFASVFSSPLTRALQTALLSMAPSNHPTLTTKGLTLISDAREVKKSRGSFDCVANVTGDAVRTRAVDLLIHLRSGGDLNDEIEEGKHEVNIADSQNQPPNGKRNSTLKKNQKVRNKRGESLTREESALAHAESEALSEIVVHPGDAGNDGIRWWSSGKEKPEASEERLYRLIEFIQLLPEADIILVTHSHLIREIFRMFASDDSSSATVKELQEKKLENCGVVAVRMEFGPLFKQHDLESSPRSHQGTNNQQKRVGGYGDGDIDDVIDVEEVHGIGKNLITDAVYVFGSACC